MITSTNPLFSPRQLQPSERPEFGELLAMFEKELNPSVNDNTEESTCFDGSDICKYVVVT